MWQYGVALYVDDKSGSRRDEALKLEQWVDRYGTVKSQGNTNMIQPNTIINISECYS